MRQIAQDKDPREIISQLMPGVMIVSAKNLILISFKQVYQYDFDAFSISYHITSKSTE